MILLAALAGLRVHEIAKVRGQDVGLDARTVWVSGKGGRVETLPLYPLLVEVAAAMPWQGWWFMGNSTRPGQPVGCRRLSKW